VYVTEATTWHPSKLPPLTAAADLALARQKYPDGLWCTSPRPCTHRVLATTSAGWSKSWPEAERMAKRDSFVCMSCRLDDAERERVAQVRREQAAVARLAAAAARLHGAGQDDAADARMNSGDPAEGLRDGSPSRRPADQGHHGVKGGRPKKHADARRAAADRATAYRRRKKLAQIAANDALVAGA
jgi:hypothetical protein